jgi:hypothetical protein
LEGKLSDLANELQRIDEELKLRDFATVSTEFLLYRKTCLQARRGKLAQELAPKPVHPSPRTKMNTPEGGGAFKKHGRDADPAASAALLSASVTLR